MRIPVLALATVALLAIGISSAFHPLRTSVPAAFGGDPIPVCPYKTCTPTIPPQPK